MRRTILMVATMALTVLVAGGVALAVAKIGTQGRDFLKGTAGADNLIGKGETDLIFGLAGNDNLLGGSGKDIVFGGTFERSLGGNKNLLGGDDNDVVFGGNGSDNIRGNKGNDLVANGPNRSRDTISAGEGNDVVGAFNDPASKDMVRCGGGFDRVFADKRDAVASDCEKVADSDSEFEQLDNSIPQSFWDDLAPPIGPQYPSKPQDWAKAAGLAKAFEKANTNPIVGDWRRKRTCEEYVSRLKQAGLTDQLQSHRALLAEFGAGDAQSGEDSNGPCRGVNGHLAHDHLFYKDGLFRSVDNNGNFVDFGPYRLPDDHTIVFPKHNESIPPVTAHFRFNDHLNTVTFYLVLPKNLDECSEKCREVYANAVQVFFSGLPWHRVCQADHKDNDVFGRADELGETCWVDPMEIENRLD
jgi:RTX calcium-binding nonapeptide repeat (4 copies)